MRAATIATVLLLGGSASAQERRDERRWSVELGATHVALGDHRPTGGWAPTIAVRRWWPTSERVRVAAGLGAAAFGFSSWHWLAMLAGPQVGVDYRVSEPWRVCGSLALDGGQIPACNNGHLCLRYWGLFPRGQAGVTYEAAPGASMGLDIGVRYVSTLGWTGLSLEPQARAVFGW